MGRFHMENSFFNRDRQYLMSVSKMLNSICHSLADIKICEITTKNSLFQDVFAFIFRKKTTVFDTSYFAQDFFNKYAMNGFKQILLG